MAQVAYLMAAVATLEAHRQRPDHIASLSLARKMLAQSRAAAAAMAGLPSATPASEDPTAVFLCMQVRHAGSTSCMTLSMLIKSVFLSCY